MTDELKPGDIVDIKDGKHKRLIDILSERVSAARVGMDAMADSYRSSLKKLWEVIHDVYPELKEYEVALDHKNLYLRVIGKADPTCDVCGERLYPEFGGCIYCKHLSRKGDEDD